MNPEERLKQLEMKVGMIMQNMAAMEKKYIDMVNHFNEQIARLDGIDKVAYAAIALHEGKAFKLNKQNIERTVKHIKDVDAKMEAWKEKQAKKREKDGSNTSEAQQGKDS